jgi:BirA family biotin operon repressor/biotin-[acetyl-CoA-carboxylase] ligase
MFSLALEPATPVERLPALSLVIADAVCDAVGLDSQVRWPNDIVIADRKLCGVLAEHREGKLVAGVGLNANLERGQLPAGARVAATSLLLETGAAIDRAQLLADLLWALELRYLAFERRGFEGLVHDNLRGRHVTLAGGIDGMCEGVDRDGRLVVAGVAHSSAEVTAVDVR